MSEETSEESKEQVSRLRKLGEMLLVLNQRRIDNLLFIFATLLMISAIIIIIFVFILFYFIY